jgi:holo-[acyl-carrier protein] synthase
MQYIGIDIVEIARIEAALGHWGDSFLKRVYTESELKLFRRKTPSLAARFAGKEAVIKALKNRNIGLRDIEILSDAGGQPQLHLHGRAQRQAARLGLDGLTISLSHCRDYAVATATGQA